MAATKDLPSAAETIAALEELEKAALVGAWKAEKEVDLISISYSTQRSAASEVEHPT